MKLFCCYSLLLTVAIGLCISGVKPGLASGTSASDRFAQIDKDASGGIDWDEFSSARPNLTDEAFKMIDKDASGVIDLAEWNAFSAEHAGHTGLQDMMTRMRGKGTMPLPPASDTRLNNTQNGIPLVLPPSHKSTPHD